MITDDLFIKRIGDDLGIIRPDLKYFVAINTKMFQKKGRNQVIPVF